MKYSEYIKSAAEQSAAFAGKVVTATINSSSQMAEIGATYMETAFGYVGEIPETAGQFVNTVNNLVSQVPRYSSEVVDSMLNAASALAEEGAKLLSPSDYSALEQVFVEYSADAINLAKAYLDNKEMEKSLNWLQVQDNGAYICGEGDPATESPTKPVVSGARRPRRRYPAGVPVVPPMPVPPTGNPTVRKLKPISPPAGSCVKKRFPQLGQFCLRSWPYYGNIVELRWWDNILIRRTWYNHFNFDRQYEEYFAGSPLDRPLDIPPELIADLPKGRYEIVTVSHNGIVQNPFAIDYYSRYEAWDWELKFKDYPSQPHEEWTRKEERHQGDEWVECLWLKYGDSPYFYHFPGIIGEDAGVSCEGVGRAVLYTTGCLTMRYLGADFPDVKETPPDAAVYLSTLGVVEALSFQSIATILGGIYGSYQSAVRRE